MAKPKTVYDERDLFEWQQRNAMTRKLFIVQRDTRVGEQLRQRRRSTVWAMHQFDVRTLTAALENKPPPISHNKVHDKGVWGLYRVVRATCEFAESKDERVRERAVAKIRKWHQIAAALHSDFLVERGLLSDVDGPVDDSIQEPKPGEDPEPYEDPNEGMIGLTD